jgi:nitric oxide reductase NorQ protein
MTAKTFGSGRGRELRRLPQVLTGNGLPIGGGPPNRPARFPFVTAPLPDTAIRIISPTLPSVDAEPYYHPAGDEVELFSAARARRLPVLLKGPTGCGKTRFVEYMAWKLGRPLVTVACHDDLSTTDLIGRYLVIDDNTVWVDGPLTAAVRAGAICYLDEIVEARKDTTVVIHPLADARRILPVEKRGEFLQAPEEFMLVVSYNPGYQSVLKEMKPSTRQRFVAIEFAYPDAATEATIVAREGGVGGDLARRLVKLGELTRNLKGAGLDEGTSTRLLVHAAQLIADGVAPRVACTGAIAQALSDDPEMVASLDDLVRSVF